MTIRPKGPVSEVTMMAPSALLGMAKPLFRRPDLWPTAIQAYQTLVPRSWWRQRPFLPLPSPEWLHFRMVTAYGGSGLAQDDDEAELPYDRLSGDLIVWLEWLRDWN